jgi:SAM-dependent methyltransferase
MYDLAATRYDRIKQFDPDWETRFVGEPIAQAVEQLSGARVLDVGAGTGRVARALLPLAGPELRLVCLEPSRKMLALGREGAPGGLWLRGRVDPLPFADGSFDIVVSLEVIEFTPQARGDAEGDGARPAARGQSARHEPGRPRGAADPRTDVPSRLLPGPPERPWAAGYHSLSVAGRVRFSLGLETLIRAHRPLSPEPR